MRIAITGLGAVTALGPDVSALERGLRAGTTGIRPLTLFDTSGFRTRLAAEAATPALPSEAISLDKSPVPLSRPDRFGLAAAAQAIVHAGLTAEILHAAALVLGTGTGGIQLTESYVERAHAGEIAPPTALLVPHQPSSVTDLVGRHFGIHGPRTTIMTACSSSATAIGYAADRIRLGHVKIAIGGGAEGLCRLTYAGFGSLRATSPDPCKPFDQSRTGLTLGEGAAMLVLEDEAHARARGATIYAYLAGYGITADAHHMTAPHPEGEGAFRAMRAALDDAKLSSDAIDYINAHGTATPHNDAAESAAIRRLLDARAENVPISSIKAMVGHTLGAAGAIEAVASVLSIHRGFIPPTLNLETPDPAFGKMDFVPGKSRDQKIRTILSNSFAFGGNNTCLAFTDEGSQAGR